MAGVNDEAQRVHQFAIDQNRHLDQIAFCVRRQFIIKTGVATRYRFQPVVKIDNHFIQRQTVLHHGAAADVGQFRLGAAAIGTQRQHRAQIFIRYDNGGVDPGLLDEIDVSRVGHVDRIMQFLHVTGVGVDFIDNTGRGGDQVEIKLALQALLDDLKMQQAQKPAAEA